MRFAIIDGKPYLVTTQGMAIPVKIAGGTVLMDEKAGFPTNEIGRYGLQEIHAKLGQNVSSITEANVRKPRKKGADE